MPDSIAIGLCHVAWREFRNSQCATAYGAALLDAHVHPRRLAPLLDWKFSTDPENQGEAKGYHQPAFDDSSWATLSTTAFWEKQGYKDYDGYGWYRRTLTVPAEWQKHNKIILHFGAVDESFRLYIDGKLVKKWGYDPTVDPDLWRKPRPVDITGHLAFGDRHTLAVQVHDTGGGGGIWKTAMVVYE